jgi:hypothetical protein
MRIRAEQIANNSTEDTLSGLGLGISDLQIAVNAAIKQKKMAGEPTLPSPLEADPTGWITRGTVNVVSSLPTFAVGLEGRVYYDTTQHNLYLAVHTGFIPLSGEDSSWVTDTTIKGGAQADDWDSGLGRGTIYSLESGQSFSTNGSGTLLDPYTSPNLYVYWNGLLQDETNYTILTNHSIQFSFSLQTSDKVTMIVPKNAGLLGYATEDYVIDYIAENGTWDGGTIHSSVIPYATTVDLGSGTQKFGNVYAQHGYFDSGSVSIGTAVLKYASSKLQLANDGATFADVILASTFAANLPTASTSVLGGVMVDGTTITITDGVISSTGGGGGGTGRTAGDTGTGFLNYHGTTKTDGQLDGGTTAPSHTTRLNYDGNLYTNNLTSTLDISVRGITVGQGAGNSFSTNTAMGNTVLAANTTGQYNTAFGYQALQTSTTATYNTAVGANALQADTIGSANTALGYTALYSNTTGASNVAVGTGALYANLADGNVGVGSGALQQNTTGSQNVAVGYQALNVNTTGGANVAIGEWSLVSNTTGNNNIAIGLSALASNMIGSSNVSIGHQSLQNNTTDYNVAIGTRALYVNTTGTYNTAIGHTAGSAVTTGSNLTIIGYQAAASSATATNEVTLGNSSVDTLRVGTTTIWTSSGGIVGGSSFATDIAVNSLTVGRGAGSIPSNTAFGWYALVANTTGGTYNTAVGYQALSNNTTAINNTGVGYSALYSNSIGTDNTAIGTYALIGSTASYNTAVGSRALSTNSTGADNTAIGYNALKNNTVGSSNTAVGESALQSNTAGDYNIAVGISALFTNTTGAYNVAVGDYALTSNTTGVHNTAVGTNTLNANTTGANNAAVGNYALQSNTTGANNTAVGVYAGNAITTGSNLTILGYNAQASSVTATNEITLGNSSVDTLRIGTTIIWTSSGGIVGGTGLVAGTTLTGFINYNGTTKGAGQFDGGTTAPSHTNRLNYDGNLYSTNLYTNSVNGISTSQLSIYAHARLDLQTYSGGDIQMASNAPDGDVGGGISIFTDANSASSTGGNVYLQTYSSNGGTAGSIVFASEGDLQFSDQYASSPINFSQSGTTGLSGFTATSIVGALNELKGGEIDLGSLAASIIPVTDDTLSLGSASNTFNSLYLSGTDGGIYFRPVGTSGTGTDEAKIYSNVSGGVTEMHFQIGADSDDRIVFEREGSNNALLTIAGDGNITISGDLTVSGTTTTVSSTNVTVSDAELILNYAATGVDPVSETGIRIRRAKDSAEGDQDSKIVWNESTNRWQLVYGATGATTSNIVVVADGLTSGSTLIGFLNYNGTTQTIGQLDGGTTAPSHTTRLNYDGNFYSTDIYASTEIVTPLITSTGSSSNDLTVNGNQNLQLSVTNTSRGSIVANANFLPDADNARDIGSSSAKFANIYGYTLYGNVSGGIKDSIVTTAIPFSQTGTGTLISQFGQTVQTDFNWPRAVSPTTPTSIMGAINANREDLYDYVELLRLEGVANGTAGGANLIGVDGITNITPTGGTAGGDSTLQAMLEGIALISQNEYIVYPSQTAFTTAKATGVGFNVNQIVRDLNTQRDIMVLTSGTGVVVDTDWVYLWGTNSSYAMKGASLNIQTTGGTNTAVNIVPTGGITLAPSTNIIMTAGAGISFWSSYIPRPISYFSNLNFSSFKCCSYGIHGCNFCCWRTE